jgi:hypothetical protein
MSTRKVTGDRIRPEKPEAKNAALRQRLPTENGLHPPVSLDSVRRGS